MQKNVIIEGSRMKKNIILLSITIAIIAVVAFKYMSYQKEYSNILKYNLEFEET
jgi:hypothetical protein